MRMGWLENAIMQGMPATLGVDTYRETYRDNDAMADERRRVRDDAAMSSRTAE
jgi:hypothetical protein